ncbi:MAG: iron-sulfur cluster-binding domain-containing protein [Saprospiraceae bacterium]|nr:iron-sulfur cluster-binding domain-containing protein [Saprospiraceae bacterium]
MEQRRRLRILAKTRETTDACTFVLEPADGRPLVYQAGQYLTLLFHSNAKEQRRAYSFSSCPGVDAFPAITVKRVVNGAFSNHLLDHVQPGEVLDAIDPNGLFVLPEKHVDTYFFIAAGSGITPVFSQLKMLLYSTKKECRDAKMVLYYANRDSQSTIFKTQIDRWILEFPGRFECTYFFSREKNADHALFRHLNNELLEQLVRAHFQGKISLHARRNTWFYLCAPKALMRMARMTLRMLNFPEKHIRQETFMPESRLPVRAVDHSKTHTILVSGRNERIEFQTYEGETILDAALRQGIALPYTCKSGVCFTCLAKCTAGHVDVAFVDATLHEGPGSMVNTCIGYAVSGRVELLFA